MSNKLRIKVGGMDYIIASDEDTEYIRKLGEELNAKLDEIMKTNSYLSTSMAAVLAALDYCDKAQKTEQKCEEISTELKSVSEELACARLEMDGARREIERLNRENRSLRIGKSAL